MDVTLDLVLIASQSQEGPMTLIAIRCPHGHSEPMVQRGQTARALSAPCASMPSGRRGACGATLVTEAVYLRCSHKVAPCVSRPVACAIRPDRCPAGLPLCGAHARRRQGGWSQCTPRCCARCPQRRLPWLWRTLAKRRWRRGGRLSGTQGIPAGAGRRSIPTQERSWPLSLGGVRRRGWCR